VLWNCKLASTFVCVSNSDLTGVCCSVTLGNTLDLRRGGILRIRTPQKKHFILFSYQEEEKTYLYPKFMQFRVSLGSYILHDARLDRASPPPPPGSCEVKLNSIVNRAADLAACYSFI
jgi:hypothetical protein